MVAMVAPENLCELKKLALYNTYRPEIKTGDLVEFASPSILGRAIRAVTRRDVNHSGLIIAPPDFVGLRHRRIILESLGRGVEMNYVSERIVETCEDGGAVYWYPLKPDFDQERDAIGTWAVDEFVIRKPRYDYGSLIRQAVARVSVDARRYFCSEWVQAAYLASERIRAIIGEVMGDRAARPGDFADLGIYGERVRLI